VASQIFGEGGVYPMNIRVSEMRPTKLIVMLLLILPVQASAEIALTVAPTFDPLAESPISVSEAAPGEILTLISTRKISVWRPTKDGQWRPSPLAFVAWAEVQADADGRIEIANVKPSLGSYTETDPMGLLWSGYPIDNPALPVTYRDIGDTPDGKLSVQLKRGQTVIASGVMTLNQSTETLRFATVQQAGLVGVYAAPKGASRLPTLIILHGSEGGSIEKATNSAASYARLGFATLALVYYSQPYEAAEFVPISGTNIDVNQLERARDWLSNQVEADIRRIGLFGTSKGGEFAMVAAARFPWVKAAVGCVPSDVVWQGFGDGENQLPLRSTWMLDGKFLPFIPLFPYVDNRYRDNTDRYERSRRFNSEAAIAARISIERTRAKLLLIGGDRDEVWASGEMARKISETMRRAGKEKQVETAIFPMAGHQICGDGSFPVRAYGKDDPDADRKSLNAEGHATVSAFRRTIAFLKSVL
jgi:pimeloyl-ACP methyl ester carboxylesterase